MQSPRMQGASVCVDGKLLMCVRKGGVQHEHAVVQGELSRVRGACRRLCVPAAAGYASTPRSMSGLQLCFGVDG